MRLALDNLIDNAIRYSDTRRWIRVAAWAERSRVYIEVSDRGTGIHADELETVKRKFVRGRLVRQGGSGLGLAIVNRVIADHGGRFVLEERGREGDDGAPRPSCRRRLSPFTVQIAKCKVRATTCDNSGGRPLGLAL